MTTQSTLKVENLKLHFPIHKGIIRRQVGKVHAVDGINFEIKQGETLGLVGESGCGKSTVGRLCLRLYEPTSGNIYFQGDDIAKYDTSETRNFRSKVQMIFQDPYASLNPRMNVGSIIREPLQEHTDLNQDEITDRVEELLRAVSLNPGFSARFPHEFSGGQRQRIGIARGLALNPNLIVCDEPIAALDVSVQAQVVNLLAEKQKELGLSYLFISHDLSMVRHIASRVAVMYLGRIVEMGTRDQIFSDPKHPYTEALLNAVPKVTNNKSRNQKSKVLGGEPPSAENPPVGCNFCGRCPKAIKECFTTDPKTKTLSDGRQVACHLV